MVFLSYDDVIHRSVDQNQRVVLFLWCSFFDFCGIQFPHANIFQSSRRAERGDAEGTGEFNFVADRDFAIFQILIDDLFSIQPDLNLMVGDL